MIKKVNQVSNLTYIKQYIMGVTIGTTLIGIWHMISIKIYLKHMRRECDKYKNEQAGIFIALHPEISDGKKIA